MADSIGKKTIKGTLWSACDRFGVMALQFCVNLTLARLLTPTDFGTIGLLTVFIVVSNTFIDGGFGSALIQKKDPTETDYSTIFIWNVGIGVLFYCVLFFCAPLIASFYRIEGLVDITRVMACSLVLGGILAVQTNRLQKRLEFKTLASTNIISYFISAAITVSAAYFGLGVWSLVIMAVCQPIVRIIILYIKTRWTPNLNFSKASFKALVSFGGYLFLGNLLEKVCNNLQGLIIGRKFSAAQMGYYTQADRLDQIVSYSVPQILAQVMYPVFSKFQSDKEKTQYIIALDLRIISFVMYPILTLLIVIAHPLVIFLYGSQWETTIEYFQILCCGGFFYCLNNIPYYAVAASGNSRSLFLAGFYKWSMLGIFLLIGMNFGMKGIIASIALSYLNIFITNCVLAKKYVGLKLMSVCRAIMPAAILCFICGTLIHVLILTLNLWFMWTIIFVALYTILSYCFNKNGIQDVKEIYIRLKNKN